MSTFLRKMLDWEWRYTKLTQRDLAPTLGLSQSVLSTYLSGTRYPDDSGIHALCSRWPDKYAGLRILIAHLHDRIKVAGRTGEVTVEADHKRPVRADVEADLETLRAEAYRPDYDDVRHLIHDLAELIRNSTPHEGEEREDRAAEGDGDYTTQPPRKPRKN